MFKQNIETERQQSQQVIYQIHAKGTFILLLKLKNLKYAVLIFILQVKFEHVSHGADGQPKTKT